MARMIDLTLDCANAGVMASFWKLTLGYIDDPAPAPFASRGEWLASYGRIACTWRSAWGARGGQ
jgi:hypothetical protein